GRRAYRFGPMLARVEPFVRRADIALCHVEHPVGRGPPSGYPRFRAPASLGGAGAGPPPPAPPPRPPPPTTASGGSTPLCGRWTAPASATPAAGPARRRA